MQRNAWYPGFVSVVRAILCWCSAFWLFSITEYHGESTGIALGPYLLFGVLCFLFFAWFLRKDRTIPGIVGAGAAFFAVGSVMLLWWFADLTGFAAYFCGVVSVCSVVVIAARVWLEPPAAARSITALECTAMFFIFFMWVQLTFDLSFAYSLPLLAATLLSMTVVLYQRLSTVGGGTGRSRLRGIIIVAVVLVAIVVVLGLFMAFGAEPLGQGVLVVYHSVVYCLKLALHLVELFMYWLTSLLPAAEGELMAEAPMEIIVVDGVPEEVQMPPWMLIVLGTVGICVVLAVVGYILFRLRKVRVHGRGLVRAGAVVERKKLPLGQWLRKLLAALRSRWLLTVSMLTMRGSPQELYLYLKRAGRHLDCRQLPGETPCAFVRRAAHMTADWADPDLPRALETLAATLGMCLYAPVAPAPLPKETVRCIRRGFGRALRKARREQLRRWFGEKLTGKKKAAEPS